MVKSLFPGGKFLMKTHIKTTIVHNNQNGQNMTNQISEMYDYHHLSLDQQINIVFQYRVYNNF